MEIVRRCLFPPRRRAAVHRDMHVELVIDRGFLIHDILSCVRAGYCETVTKTYILSIRVLRLEDGEVV